jgi:hypothetical protein
LRLPKSSRASSPMSGPSARTSSTMTGRASSQPDVDPTTGKRGIGRTQTATNQPPAHRIPRPIFAAATTLAPVFAAAFATHNSWVAFLVGLAALVGARRRPDPDRRVRNRAVLSPRLQAPIVADLNRRDAGAPATSGRAPAARCQSVRTMPMHRHNARRDSRNAEQIDAGVLAVPLHHHASCRTEALLASVTGEVRDSCLVERRFVWLN